jgi:SAM-dependent methyltransferase
MTHTLLNSIKANEFQELLIDKGITPASSKNVIDLGAGHGLQSVPLARIGFNVTAVDFNEQLLEELKANAEGLKVKILVGDIRRINQYANDEVELVVCCGDTLSHLSNRNEIRELITEIVAILKPGGKVLFSFRDYSAELTGDSRFIPVKSDDTRILTCVLDYEEEFVTVTDLLYERTETGWKQRVSSYVKVRISSIEIVEFLEANGMKIQLNEVFNRLTTIIAVKK